MARWTRHCLIPLAACLMAAAGLGAAESPPGGVEPIVKSLMSEEAELRGVPFGEVIHAATGRRVIPLDTGDQASRELVGKISGALDAMLSHMGDASHAAHQEKRINEVSAHFEKALMQALNAVPGFKCEHPRTASGRAQRSGYPDLRLEDSATGRVVYLDPKLFDQKNRSSSLRTFYYEPKQDTNKVLEDAHHLLVGISHGGKEDDTWRFLGWELVDLSKFRVRLKAEFQGSNRDLYQPGTIIGTSRK